MPRRGARDARRSARRLAAKVLRKKMRAKARGERDDGEEDEKNVEDDASGKGASEGGSVPDYFMDAMKKRGTRPARDARAARVLAAGVRGEGCARDRAAWERENAWVLITGDRRRAGGSEGTSRGWEEARGRAAVLVVAPARELALQIAGVCNKLKKAVPVRAVAVYGGASQEEQEEALTQHTSHALVVIGTPGRLLAVLESGLRRRRLDRSRDARVGRGRSHARPGIRGTTHENSRRASESRAERSSDLTLQRHVPQGGAIRRTRVVAARLDASGGEDRRRQAHRTQR